MTELAGASAILALSPEHADRLGLVELPAATRRHAGLVPAIPVDSGSAFAGSPDGRAHTVRMLVDPETGPPALSSPGHMHTAIAREGGGEASSLALELARQAGGEPCVVLSPVLGDDGRPLGLAQAQALPRLADVPVAPASELRSRALARELGAAAVHCALPTRLGSFRAVALRGAADGATALALVHGDPHVDPEAAVVRTHVACMLGDTFGSTLCGCRAALEHATREIVAAGSGVMVYVKPVSANPLECPAGRSPDRVLTAELLDDAGLSRHRVAA
jgi:3,4-dihydroxy 2-butanone 4-phosphate synthase / GTP cyclohydrolase II